MTTAVPAEAVGTTSTAEVLPLSGRPDNGAAGVRLAELFAAHGATVLGLCRMLLRNRHEAEDAVQQTFLSAYTSLLNGTEPRHPAAWLATIARNECRGRIERRMREPLSEVETESPLPDPVAAAAARADLQALWHAIGELPRRQRKALLLREFSGLSYEELAAALAVSAPTVESLLFRARRDLRARLRPVTGSAASVAPLTAIREALARAIGGMPDPSAGALAGLATPLVAKVAAGVAVVAVAGGTVAAVETRSGDKTPAPARVQSESIPATSAGERPAEALTVGGVQRPDDVRATTHSAPVVFVQHAAAVQRQVPTASSSASTPLDDPVQTVPSEEPELPVESAPLTAPVEPVPTSEPAPAAPVSAPDSTTGTDSGSTSEGSGVSGDDSESGSDDETTESNEGSGSASSESGSGEVETSGSSEESSGSGSGSSGSSGEGSTSTESSSSGSGSGSDDVTSTETSESSHGGSDSGSGSDSSGSGSSSGADD